MVQPVSSGAGIHVEFWWSDVKACPMSNTMDLGRAQTQSICFKGMIEVSGLLSPNDNPNFAQWHPQQNMHSEK